MALDFGAALGAVGNLNQAVQANRQRMLEERRQQVLDQQTAQREAYQNAYQQVQTQRMQKELENAYHIKTVDYADGSQEQWMLLPSGGMEKIKTQPPDPNKQYQEYLKYLSPEARAKLTPEREQEIQFEFRTGRSLPKETTSKPQWKVDAAGNAYWEYAPDAENPAGSRVPAGTGFKAQTSENEWRTLRAKQLTGEPLSPQEQADMKAIQDWINLRITNPTMAKMQMLVQSRIVQVVDPNNPGITRYMPAGQASAAGMQAPSSLSHMMAMYYGTGKGGQNLLSLNVLSRHLKIMTDMAVALKNGDTRLINQAGNAWQTEFGSAAPTNFNVIRGAVADETERMLTGVGVTQAGVKSQVDNINSKNSPEQLLGAIQSIKDIAQGRIQGDAQQYMMGTQYGVPDFPEDMVPLPQAAAPGGGGAGRPKGGGGGDGAALTPDQQQLLNDINSAMPKAPGSK